VIRKRVLISGQVQGVFFRETCRRMADQNGVAGWVHNRYDGRVEAVFEGPPEAVDRLVAWAHRGPRGAIVTGVTVHDEQPTGLTDFEVK
jgi:acylphosphatase